jgi:hypothetical protein
VVRRAVQTVYEDRDIQRDLPSPEPERPLPAPRDPTYDVPSDALGTLAKVLLWGFAAAAAAYLIFMAWNRWGRPGAALRPAVVAAPRAPIELGAPAQEADALAAQGRYAEAVHHLLLMTLEALVAARGAGLPPAFTSREILARIEMGEGARAALRGLVDAVERMIFAGRPATAADYASCRATFDRFVAACAEAPA